MKTEFVSKVGLSFVLSFLMLSSLAFAQGLEGVIGTLEDIGVFQFYLPFIIAFAILFGLLQKIQVFGEKGKPINIIISLAIAAFVMVYTPVGMNFSQFLTNFFGNAIVVILTIIVLIMFASLLTAGNILNLKDVISGGWLKIGLLLLLLLVFGVFIASGGTAIFPGLKISANELFGPIGGLSSATVAIIVLVVGTALIVFLFGRGDGEDKKKQGQGQGQGQ